MSKRPYVDEKTCIGCQLCLSIDPVFVVKENGKAQATENDFDAGKVDEAIESCPVESISWKKK